MVNYIIIYNKYYSTQLRTKGLAKNLDEKMKTNEILMKICKTLMNKKVILQGFLIRGFQAHSLAVIDKYNKYYCIGSRPKGVDCSYIWRVLEVY